MKGKRRREIILETFELTVIRSQPRPEFFCVSCGVFVPYLKAAQAALVFSLSEREIFRQADNQEIHFAENENGELLVCLNSLRASC